MTGIPHVPVALSAPVLNRGVGFTHEQRRRLGLTGRLPAGVLSEHLADVGLLPSVTDLPTISAAVTEAVYHAAVADGVARKTYDDVGRAMEDIRWHASYDD
jgi:malate dehydrogenase (oxaloacetate-decarboxylating)